MAPSRLSRRASSVKRNPPKYFSKARRCCSQRMALRVWLTRLLMTHPHPALRPAQHPRHEGRGLLAREPPGEFHSLTYGYVGGYVIHEAHLVERQPQDIAVHSVHPVHRPADRDLREHRVQVLLLALDPACEPDGVLLEVSPVRAPALEGRLDGALVHVALVEHEKRLLARPPPTQRSDPREIVVRARVHPHPVPDVNEERHLHHDAGLEGGGLAPAGRRVAFEARVGLRDLQVYVRRGLDAHYLAVSREH